MLTSKAKEENICKNPQLVTSGTSVKSGNSHMWRDKVV